jgi:hypothetical protein
LIRSSHRSRAVETPDDSEDLSKRQIRWLNFLCEFEDEGFRKRLVDYLEQVIKLDYDWTRFPDETDVLGQHKSENAAYSFPDYGDGSINDLLEGNIAIDSR